MMSLVLASKSLTRQRLLHQAGLAFDVLVSPQAEENLKKDLLLNRTEPEKAAVLLADEKARLVTLDHPDCYVLGADQTCGLGGRWIQRAHKREEAYNQLGDFSGKTHVLTTAVCLWRNGECLWRYAENAYLTLLALSTEAQASYLSRLTDEDIQTFGLYQIEGIGIQLFSSVSGDFFTIQGLPLLPVLGILRYHGLYPL